jgi:spermidine/putrescine transport system permease protein
LYSPFAVILTLTHIYTPFAFLPIYASLEHIQRNLVEASQDLGASRLRTFWTVIFPLALPGVLAGATFAFVLSLGDFLSPLLIGGPSGIMISNVVVSLFGAAYDWPLGSAISLSMLASRRSGASADDHSAAASLAATLRCDGVRVSVPSDRGARHIFVQR